MGERSCRFPFQHAVRLTGAACGLLYGLFIGTSPSAAADSEQFFESQVRPILAEHCVRCHGAEEQSGNLRLDSNAALRAGGERGTVLDAAQPAASLLLQAVRHEGELEMPPD